MFDWTDARIFLAVCATRSFTAAAKTLAMDQTTVGRRVAALEIALDTKLFRRGPGGLTLTANGEEARVHAATMEAAAYDLDRHLRGRDRALRGVVRITTVESFARAFLAPRLPALHAKHPAIDVSLKTNSRILSLTKREADIAIRHVKPSQAGLVARRIARVAFAAYAAPTYDLASERYLGFEDELATMPDADWLARPDARLSLRSNSRAVLEAAAAAGLGVAILPCYLGDRRSDLVRITHPRLPLVRDLWLVFHEELKSQARVRVVAEFVAEEAARAKARLLGRG